MMRWKNVCVAFVTGVGCVSVVPRALQAESGARGLTNPFFALHNCTKDDKPCTAACQAEMLKELGYAGISHSGVEGIPEMLEALDKNGLKMFTDYVGARLDAQKPPYDPKLPGVIQSLKGRETMIWLYIQSGEHKPSSPEGDARAVAIVRELADLAAESGLRVALYPHFGFWLERVEDAVRVAKQADRKNVGVTFNLCHWLKVDGVETMKARLELARPYLYVVTVNGADAGGKGWEQLIQPLDRGSFDMVPFLKTLRELGFTGPIGFQCYGIKGDRREILKRSMDAWRRDLARVAGQ
jgi:sugar phosphate isomerase/epimerase